MKNSIIIIIALFISFSMTAQSEMASNDFTLKSGNALVGGFGEDIEFTAEEEETASILPTSFQRTAKKVANDFNGFKIELTSSTVALDAENQIFFDFGGVTYSEEIHSFNYFLGSFVSKESAQDYLNKVIQDRYPTARIVEFKNGASLNQTVKVVQCFELMD